jgi:hypothetical protein
MIGRLPRRDIAEYRGRSVAVRFLEGLIPSQRYQCDQARGVLAFLGTYSRTDVLAALERVVRYVAYSATAVERILAAQARPLGLLEKLAAQSSAEDPFRDGSPALQLPSDRDYEPLLSVSLEEPADACPFEPHSPKSETPESHFGATGFSPEECPF